MSRKFENDRPGHRPDPEVTEVRTTDARLGQLRAVLDTGAVRPIACDAELAAAHATAVAGVEASGRADGVPRKAFNSYRQRLGRLVDIAGEPVHHRGFPMRDHAADVLNAEKLDVTAKGRLPAGSGAPAHEQLHEVYGGRGLTDKRDKYKAMAWGDLPEPAGSQLARWQAFENPRARVPLDEVAERIAQANAASRKERDK